MALRVRRWTAKPRQSADLCSNPTWSIIFRKSQNVKVSRSGFESHLINHFRKIEKCKTTLRIHSAAYRCSKQKLDNVGGQFSESHAKNWIQIGHFYTFLVVFPKTFDDFWRRFGSDGSLLSLPGTFHAYFLIDVQKNYFIIFRGKFTFSY